LVFLPWQKSPSLGLIDYVKEHQFPELLRKLTELLYIDIDISQFICFVRK